MKRIQVLAGLALALAGPAAAQSQAAAAVSQGRAAGLVGERFDGFLGISAPGGAAYRQQVAAINIRRRSLYAQLSASRGVSLSEVGLTAACQLLGTVGVGERYMLSDNIWRVRNGGEPTPTPDYCR